MNPDRSDDPATWVDEHGDALFRYAMLRLKDAERAEDAVQETFLAALHADERFAQRSTRRTWLIGILKRKIVDDIRRTSRQNPAPGDEDMKEPALEFFNAHRLWKSGPRRWGWRPERVLEEQEFWGVLQRCLSGLSPKLAQAFTLRELDGRTSEEIREILAVSATNLWTILHRARLQLRRCLEVHWFDRGKEKEERPC
jgi:RNA polymerase sigma-70 factor (ECF subfamily)